MTISLAFLAPDLVKAAIDGRLPYGMGIASLTDLPAEWSKQREMLGAFRPTDAAFKSSLYQSQFPRRETRFCGAETMAPKRPLQSK
jgi:hypothetical protein